MVQLILKKQCPKDLKELFLGLHSLCFFPPLISLISSLLLLLLSLYGGPRFLPNPFINTLIAQVSRGFSRFADTYKSHRDMCVHVCTHRHTHTRMPRVLLGFTFVNKFTSLVAAVSLLCDLFPITASQQWLPCSTKHHSHFQCCYLLSADRNSIQEFQPFCSLFKLGSCQERTEHTEGLLWGMWHPFPFFKKDFFLWCGPFKMFLLIIIIVLLILIYYNNKLQYFFCFGFLAAKHVGS